MEACGLQRKYRDFETADRKESRASDTEAASMSINMGQLPAAA